MSGEKETSSKAIMIREGRAFIHVRNLERALKFYKNILGIHVERSDSDWVDLAPILEYLSLVATKSSSSFMWTTSREPSFA